MIRTILLTVWLAFGVLTLRAQQVTTFEVNLPVATNGLDIPVSARIGSGFTVSTPPQSLRRIRAPYNKQLNHFSSIKCSV